MKAWNCCIMLGCWLPFRAVKMGLGIRFILLCGCRLAVCLFRCRQGVDAGLQDRKLLPSDILCGGLWRGLWALCGALYKVVNFHGRFAAGVRLFEINNRAVAVPECCGTIWRDQIVVGFLLVLYPDNGLPH